MEEKILVIDDEKGIQQFLEKALFKKGYKVETAGSGQSALNILKKSYFPLVLLDFQLPKPNGIELLKIIKKNYPETEVIMMTGHGTMRLALDAMKIGAYDYLNKPFGVNDLLSVVKNVFEKREIAHRNETLPDQVRPGLSYKIIGETKAVKSVLGLAQRLAPADSNLVIYGETGTGKELIARYIHENSNRKNKRLVIVNCASLPDNLLESELFGYEPGAFTDASRLKYGLLEVADGGTLFLDEIAEVSHSIQAKLLRAVETGEFRRLGGNQDIKVNIRVISATNKDLSEEVAKGNFREDLFYRLNVVAINMPPLRERREDIPLIVDHFLNSIITDKKGSKEIAEEAMHKLKNYDWPGNIRQLRNVIERAVLLTDKNVIEKSDLPGFISQSCEKPEQFAKDKKLALSEIEKEHIKRVLRECGNNRIQAAKVLEISVRTLYNKIKDYGIEN
ncbi:MAG: sigma-54-dependent Fis family transcriptional regulator [Elusimicrobia bacterium]|nr:sigma-54-dependent Fis family transcriptional regulator [Elusimicrobiota bacterium]